MRRSLSRISYPVIGRPTTAPSYISAAFSTSSAGGGGGGRGRGRSTPFQFIAENRSQAAPDNSQLDDASPPPQGHGRGRGQSLPPPATPPLFSSFINNASNAPPIGRGRGFIPNNVPSPPAQQDSERSSQQPRPLKPNFKMQPISVKDGEALSRSTESEFPERQEKLLPGDSKNIISGSGRGKPTSFPEQKQAENRHIRQPPRPRPPVAAASGVAAAAKNVEKSSREQMSQEEKVKMAVSILSRGGDGGSGRGAVAGGRGGRGRGRGRGRFGGRGRGQGSFDPDEDEDAGGLSLGDPGGEEKLAQNLGPEKMSILAEAFEEVAPNVLPSPIDDAYLDALHTNLSIECEPEYLMEEFGTNPDIDEKPPIPLRDALEKMKPFLMAYEGIQSQEEWEEVIEETMKNVPLIKEIVDYYSGPDRVTAKQQQEELERVAKTLPATAPASVKRFTDRAVLSLQSNPGWGFYKKCQFMDKLVMEVSNQYK